MMLLERILVYHPPHLLGNEAEIEALGGEEIRFQAADGTKLGGWFYAHPSPRFAILYTYGNGEDSARNAEYMAYLRDSLQAAVLCFDYRGYGKSEGKPVEQGLILDGMAAHQWLTERLDIDASEVVLFGRSLGGGVAVALAERVGARALIVHASFANMVDIGATRYPWLPVRLMMKNRYHSEQRIKSYEGPLLQIHGTADQIVPIHLARPLFEASPSAQKQFVTIPDGTHNEGLTDEAFSELERFLDQTH